MKPIAFLTAAASLLAAPAVAHVTFTETDASAGSTVRAVLRAPHGCDDEATTSFEEAWYDELGVRSSVESDLAPGTELMLEAAQTGSDASAARTPELIVAARAAGHGMAHAGPAPADDASWTLGAIEITRPFARATLPNAPVAGGFMSIRNDGAEDDRLVAAQSAVAGRMEVHEMTMEDDVMRMRELADGLPIPAGATVDLVPGGYHLMFMNLRQPLVEGEAVDVTLTFEKAGEITVPLAIGPADARAGEMDHGDIHHGDMDHGAMDH